MTKIGVLISGGGTNLQAIIDACAAKEIDAEVSIVVSNRPDAYGLQRAEKVNIPNEVINDDQKLLETLITHQVDIVVLAGYLKLVPKEIVKYYDGRILNIHPSLIPSFSGKGFYGIKVHEAVIKRGVKFTGATVHLVNENFDEGKILEQEIVPVYENDTPEELQQRVLKVEHKIFVKAIKELIEDKKEFTNETSTNFSL